MTGGRHSVKSKGRNCLLERETNAENSVCGGGQTLPQRSYCYHLIVTVSARQEMQVNYASTGQFPPQGKSVSCE
jgi:hypothetical protein